MGTFQRRSTFQQPRVDITSVYFYTDRVPDMPRRRDRRSSTTALPLVPRSMRNSSRSRAPTPTTTELRTRPSQKAARDPYPPCGRFAPDRSQGVRAPNRAIGTPLTLGRGLDPSPRFGRSGCSGGTSGPYIIAHTMTAACLGKSS